MMILQYTAAALASENKVLVHPGSADPLTSANQEDHVSMGATSARHTRQVPRPRRRDPLALERRWTSGSTSWRRPRGSLGRRCRAWGGRGPPADPGGRGAPRPRPGDGATSRPARGAGADGALASSRADSHRVPSGTRSCSGQDRRIVVDLMVCVATNRRSAPEHFRPGPAAGQPRNALPEAQAPRRTMSAPIARAWRSVQPNPPGSSGPGARGVPSAGANRTRGTQDTHSRIRSSVQP